MKTWILAQSVEAKVNHWPGGFPHSAAAARARARIFECHADNAGERETSPALLF
jgi:hypothetical protein